jgi:hypothetical protein
VCKVLVGYLQFCESCGSCGSPKYVVSGCRAAPEAKLNEIKALLGKMLFSGAGMEKKVEWLSGGEKARLALAKFMLTQVTYWHSSWCSACCRLCPRVQLVRLYELSHLGIAGHSACVG